MHLGASSSNLIGRDQEFIKYHFCRFLSKMYRDLCYYDIHTPISSLWFIPKLMYKYALVAIWRLLYVYFAQIFPLLFFHHA